MTATCGPATRTHPDPNDQREHPPHHTRTGPRARRARRGAEGPPLGMEGQGGRGPRRSSRSPFLLRQEAGRGVERGRTAQGSSPRWGGAEGGCRGNGQGVPLSQVASRDHVLD